jgi:hypothetical protein
VAVAPRRTRDTARVFMDSPYFCSFYRNLFLITGIDGEMLRLWRGRSHLKFGGGGKEEKAEGRKDKAERHNIS